MNRKDSPEQIEILWIDQLLHEIHDDISAEKRAWRIVRKARHKYLRRVLYRSGVAMAAVVLLVFLLWPGADFSTSVKSGRIEKRVAQNEFGEAIAIRSGDYLRNSSSQPASLQWSAGELTLYPGAEVTWHGDENTLALHKGKIAVELANSFIITTGKASLHMQRGKASLQISTVYQKEHDMKTISTMLLLTVQLVSGIGWLEAQGQTRPLSTKETATVDFAQTQYRLQVKGIISTEDRGIAFLSCEQQQNGEWQNRGTIVVRGGEKLSLPGTEESGWIVESITRQAVWLRTPQGQLRLDSPFFYQPQNWLQIKGRKALSPLEVVQYKIIVSNPGTKTLRNVPLRCTLPANLSYIASYPELQAQGQQYTYTIPQLVPGEDVEINFDLKATGKDRAEGELQLVLAERTITLTFSAFIGMVDSLHLSSYDTEDPCAKGERLFYIIEVKNEGTRDITGLSVQNQIPKQMEWLSATPQPSEVKGKILVFPMVGRLAPGEKLVYRVECTAIAVGNAKNRVSLRCDQWREELVDEEQTSVYE